MWEMISLYFIVITQYSSKTIGKVKFCVQRLDRVVPLKILYNENYGVHGFNLTWGESDNGEKR